MHKTLDQYFSEFGLLHRLYLGEAEEGGFFAYVQVCVHQHTFQLFFLYKPLNQLFSFTPRELLVQLDRQLDQTQGA